MTTRSGDLAQAVPRIPLNVRFRRYKGKLVVLGYEHALELEPPADFIWLRIDGATSVAGIAEQVTAEYAVEEQTALDDVSELIGQLLDQGLLELAPEVGTGD